MKTTHSFTFILFCCLVFCDGLFGNILVSFLQNIQMKDEENILQNR